MRQTAITVEGLGKAYHIGLKEEIPDTLVGVATSWLKSPILNFRNLCKLDTFATDDDDHPDTVWALRDVSFEVAEGEILGVIGRNGAGKSTLLKILSRITEPTRGRAIIRGRVSSLLEVGTGFHPELTGRENIYMNGTILGMRKKEIDRKLDQIIDFSGVEKFLDTPIKRYSSGMKVRLAFSVAAHLEPEILIIDEVLAVGDAEFQKKCMGKMHDVANSGRTVLFVSHNMGAVQTLCERAIVLRNGTKVYDKEAADAVRTYLQAFSSHSSNPFENNPDRSGDGSCRLIGARLLDSTGQRTSGLTAGLPATFSFEYENATNATYGHIDMTLYNEAGVAVSSFDMKLTKFSPFLLRLRGEVKCSIPSLPLPVGEYRVATAIYADGRMTDHIPNALKLSVDASVFYGNGSNPRKNGCTCMIQHEWSDGEVNGSR